MIQCLLRRHPCQIHPISLCGIVSIRSWPPFISFSPLSSASMTLLLCFQKLACIPSVEVALVWKHRLPNIVVTAKRVSRIFWTIAVCLATEIVRTSLFGFSFLSTSWSREKKTDYKFGNGLAGSLGADCANLGITLSNSTSPASPPSLSDNGSSSGGGKSNLLVLLRTENRCDETLLDLYVNRYVSSQYIAMDGCAGDSCRHGLHEIRRTRSIVIVFFCPHSAYRYRWSSTIRIHSAWYLFWDLMYITSWINIWFAPLVGWYTYNKAGRSSCSFSIIDWFGSLLEK